MRICFCLLLSIKFKHSDALFIDDPFHTLIIYSLSLHSHVLDEHTLSFEHMDRHLIDLLVIRRRLLVAII